MKLTSLAILTKCLLNRIRVLLVGPPGCGKTARIFAAALLAGFQVVVVRASLMERIDVTGALVPDVAAGITRQLPLEDLAKLKTTTVPTILFLDDLGQAMMETQAALMKYFDRMELPDCVLIWGATNRPADKASVVGLCEPLRSRFDLKFSIPTPGAEDKADGPVMLGDWGAETDGWCEWCIEAHPEAYEVAAWHRSAHLGASYAVGPVLYGHKPSSDPAMAFPDFRSWEVVCRLIESGITEFSFFAATVGKGQASAFLTFREMAGQLVDMTMVAMDPDGCPVPTDAGALCYVATRLGASVEVGNANAFCRYIDRLPQIFAALAAKDAYKRLGAKLSGCKAWQTWFLKNGDLFRA